MRDLAGEANGRSPPPCSHLGPGARPGAFFGAFPHASSGTPQKVLLQMKCSDCHQ